MEVGYAEAETGGWLKSTARGVHADRRWCEGVFWREHQRSPVLAAFVRGFRRAREDVVPFENVAFRWMRDNEGGWVLRNRFIFFCETFGRRYGSHGETDRSRQMKRAV